MISEPFWNLRWFADDSESTFLIVFILFIENPAFSFSKRHFMHVKPFLSVKQLSQAPKWQNPQSSISFFRVVRLQTLHAAAEAAEVEADGQKTFEEREGSLSQCVSSRNSRFLVEDSKLLCSRKRITLASARSRSCFLFEQKLQNLEKQRTFRIRSRDYTNDDEFVTPHLFLLYCHFLIL